MCAMRSHESAASIKVDEDHARAKLRKSIANPDFPAKRNRNRVWDDPALVDVARGLRERGYSQIETAKQMGLSITTIKKMIVPGFAEKEAIRMQDYEKYRHPVRKNTKEYIDYQATYGLSETHKERVKKQTSDVRREKGIKPRKSHRFFTDEEIALLGTMSDVDLAAKLGRYPSVIWKKRREEGIKSFGGS